MRTPPNNRILYRLNQPLSTLQAYADRIARLPAATGHARLYPLITAINCYAITAARVSTYLTSRYMHGADHAAAVKRQNKVAAHVRTALGYTYAKDDIDF